MIVEHFPVAPLGCNCTILGDEDRGEAIVVDPGGEHERISAGKQHIPHLWCVFEVFDL